jgi:hypothetical protein
MDRGFFAFPVEIERALPTSMTTPTTTATTIRLIPALSPTQLTTESLPTWSTRLKIVEDALKGFNLTHLTEFEREYPSFDFDQEIKTFKLNLLNPEEASITDNAQLPTAEMKTITQMVFFIFFCMMAYIMHKILIRVYTEAMRELERASFFERETPYTIFCLLVQQGLGKCYPPIRCSRKDIRRRVLADIHEHLSMKAATLNSLSQAQTPSRRRQAAPDDSEDSDDAYAVTLKSIKDSYQANAGRFLKGTPHPTKLANKEFEFELQVPKRGMSAAPRMVINLLREVVDYDLPCDLSQTYDPVMITPSMIWKTRIKKRLSEIQDDPGYITGSKSQSEAPSSSEQESSSTPPISRPVHNLLGRVTMSKVTEIPADQSEVTEVTFSRSGVSVFSSVGATSALSMQGEQESRDLSLTIDPTRLGARTKTPKAPILEEKEDDDLSEKVTTKDLVTRGAGSGPSVTETRITTEAEVYPDEDAQLEAKMNAEFVKHMTKAANTLVSSKNAAHVRVLKEVTFSPIAKRGGTPGLSSTGNSELTSSTPSTK